MASQLNPSDSDLAAAAELLGVRRSQQASRASLAGALIGALTALATPSLSRIRLSPSDRAEFRRERVAYYLALGFTQQAIVSALANESPAIEVRQSTVSKDARLIRERWKRRQVDARHEAVERQLHLWDHRLRELHEAWSHDMAAYRAHREHGSCETGAQTGRGCPERADGHVRSAGRLHTQILEIERQRRAVMGLDASETGGSFHDLLVAKAEELGWPQEAIADLVANAEQFIRGGFA